MSNPERMGILIHLQSYYPKSLNVSSIAEYVKLNEKKVEKHLDHLYRTGLVIPSLKEGKTFYEITDYAQSLLKSLE